MIKLLLNAFQSFAMGAWAVIKSIAISLWNEPILLELIVIVIACNLIKRKLYRRH